MKKIALLLFAVASFTVTAQQKASSQKVANPQTMKTASGLEYTITERGNGKKAMVGDKVIVHYTGKLTNDTVFDSSVGRKQPFTFKLGAGQVIKGWDEAFQLLQVGDKATIKFGHELGYGERGSGAIPPKATLIFDVEFLDIIEGPRPWEATKKDTVSLPNGVKYLLIKENKTATKIENGSRLTVHYSGFFTDGKRFDSSVERGQAVSLNMGKGMVLKSLEDALYHLHKGEKAKIYIPHALAYGEKGQPPVIPAKADLVYDIEIIDVQPPAVITKYDIAGKELKTTASGLKYYEVVKASGTAQALAGNTVKVHYSGYLVDGKMFDSSLERGAGLPFEFKLGAGNVIAGWDEGLALMHVGDKFKFQIPYYLAYGEIGHPPTIPAKAELTFDVELIGIK